MAPPQSHNCALPAMRRARHIWNMACYVYVLAAREKNGRLVTYVGWTLDLERRLAEHNGQGGRGAKSTRGRIWTLLYAEKHRTRRRAMAREHALKNDRKFRARLRAG